MLLLLLLLSVLLSLLLAYYNANSYCARYPFVYRRATELTLFCRCVMSPGDVSGLGRWGGGPVGSRVTGGGGTGVRIWEKVTRGDGNGGGLLKYQK